jgi:hypothetical protein
MTDNSSDDRALREHAAKLHAELAAALQADPSRRRAHDDTLQHVQQLIGGSAGPPPGSLVDRLESVAVQFEAGHPTLAASARRLIDLLGEVGI